jgi:hypothetical protein
MRWSSKASEPIAIVTVIGTFNTATHIVVELGTDSDLEGLDGDSGATLSSPLYRSSFMFKTFKEVRHGECAVLLEENEHGRRTSLAGHFLG